MFYIYFHSEVVRQSFYKRDKKKRISRDKFREGLPKEISLIE